MIKINLRKGDRIMACVMNDMLTIDDGPTLGPFSSHKAACAALMRLNDLSYASPGGDNAHDLAIEQIWHHRARAR